jgi:hypothetical protein
MPGMLISVRQQFDTLILCERGQSSRTVLQGYYFAAEYRQ